MEVEREFVLRISAAAGEEERRKKILWQGRGAGPERIGQGAAAQEEAVSMVHSEATLTALTGH